MIDMDQEVANLLKNPEGASVEKIAFHIRWATAAATVAENAGKAARLKSIDPKHPDGVAERSRAEDQEFIAQRLRNAVAALAPLHEAAIRKDELEKWKNATADIRARIVDLSKELQSTYEECVGKLVDVFKRSETLNNEAQHFGLAPAGCGIGSVTGSARIRDVILPMLGSSRGVEPLWPPPKAQFGVEYAAMVGQMMRGALPVSDEQRNAEAARTTEFYRRQEHGRVQLNEAAEARARRAAAG